MDPPLYQYRAFIENQIDALNTADWQRLTRSEDFSDRFVKYMYPKSMGVPEQTREEWQADLTSGFVAENYKSSTAVVTNYWEAAHEKSAIAWLHESGKLTDDSDYEFDYLMRYEFDESGKLLKLYEYNDSYLQNQIAENWMKRKATTKDTQLSKRFYLLSYPRTASHLLMRMLNLNNQTEFAVYPDDTSPYFFMDALDAREKMKNWHKHVEELSEDTKSKLKESYQSCANRMEGWIKNSEAQGKAIFLKEHITFMTSPVTQCEIIHGRKIIAEDSWTVQLEAGSSHSQLNCTVLSDEFLATWHPTFLIRHPALAFPSHYRTFIDLEGIDHSENQAAELKAMITIKPVRMLYDWYRENIKSEGWPIVLDASTIINEPGVVAQYAKILGLDASKVQNTWGAASDNEKGTLRDDAQRRMLSTLSSSTGILKDKAPTQIDLEAEAQKWRKEFGEQEGDTIAEWVREAMPDYEYLRSKQLRAE
ncbi:hypothetical protein H2198_000225 [Neophaeococcomyces mojaviensis]|uniref:Uncharacterized protein n=1 Tax=Neophaeococcomyces mojaviensis TaxID=3383035 RepID=A0ACC3AKP2_9EURO|nr:hypothetical protein H2198_000225 [Knufia sp. JES_112]